MIRFVEFKFRSFLYLFLLLNSMNAFSQSLSDNSYIEELNDSLPLNEIFNTFFQQRLVENKNPYLNMNASNYLLSIPKFDHSWANEKVNSTCDFKKYEAFSENKINLPFANKAIVRKTYCQMQQQFSGMTPEQFNPAPILPSKVELYQKALERLQKKDTLVVVIPGIFGEFIDQIAFGEAFGQGLRKGNRISQFEKEFDDFIINNDLKNNPQNPMGQSKRFLLKNLRRIKSDNDDMNSLYDDIPINNWIRVASIDKDGHPLFKIAVFNLEPMSLESLGHQEDLAILYNQRLIKFLEIYKKMSTHDYPDHILFVGYSRGTPVAMEMLGILKYGEYSNSDRYSKLKNEIKNSARPWFSKVSSLTSLGGVVYGSSLADSSLIMRDKAPFKARFLHEFKNLIFDLKIINESDMLFLNKINFTSSDNSIHSFRNLIHKLKNNAEVWKRFLNFLEHESHNFIYFSDKDQRNLKNILSSLNQIKNHSIDNFSVINNHGMENLKSYFSNLIDFINSSSELLPDFMGMSSFTQKIINNFGFIEAREKTKQSIYNKEFIALLKESNYLFAAFSYYFQSVWNGANELSTLSRINWMSQWGSRMPSENFTYYSVIGILGENPSDFFNSGVNFGFNLNSLDEYFLDKSWFDLQNVGVNDGLDLTFAGSKINDSQVDAYKTVLWPSLTKAITGKTFRSKILGIAKTHHWGLALPYAFLNKGKDQNEGPIYNPFPRGELIESIVLSIESDLFK